MILKENMSIIIIKNNYIYSYLKIALDTKEFFAITYIIRIANNIDLIFTLLLTE
jgi:hypothetical protein